jgi:hypothetical protein
MHVSIQLLRKDDNIRTVLQKDGWDLKAESQPNAMSARHPEVGEERTARQRLHNLGLLTCHTCRIEFRR